MKSFPSYNYPANIESKLGFDAIREYLKERCQSALGVEEVEAMSFSSDHRKIAEFLRQTFEMKGLLEIGGEIPDASFNSLEQWLPGLKIEGSYASGEDMLKLLNSLLSFEKVRAFFGRRTGGDEEGKYLYPSLAALFSNLEAFPDLTKAISRVIDNTGAVKDSASPELGDIRSRLSSLQGSIARTIQRIYAQVVKEGIAEKDSAPTFRDGRMVIPVPAPNKRRVPGIVHDESATGKTVFIEPSETVELSNRIRELEIEEKRIIVRILIQLSDQIRPWTDNILQSNNLLGKMDFIMAKAKFAIEIGGDLPVITKHPEIDWYGAIHPVLFVNLHKQGRGIVPLNIRLEGKKRILLISGPNAGGKSVALKTVGIIQYMTQCGLLPTMHSNSHIGFFNKIFIDIGDEQSIENDLSTYSSHLKNMRYFMLHSDARTLILIDEIGSGTEPNIGSSLAKAILVELAKSRCFGVITTHYHNLKRFAEEAETFINGAMLYDRQKLQPTFQLSIGNAGSSFALEIAGKIGLPHNVIEMAKQEVGEDYVESDRYLMEIARDRKYWQSKRASIKERENKIEALEQKYEKLIAEINSRRKEIISEAQEEAKLLLSGANKKIENTISEIRKIEAEKEKTKLIRRGLDQYKQEVENVVDQQSLLKPVGKLRGKRQKKSHITPVSPLNNDVENSKRELRKGDFVKMSGANTVGQILEISGNEAKVAFGSLHTKVKLSKLSATAKPTTTKPASYNLINSGRQRQLEFKDELDIRGARADEALDRLIHFIDDAIQFRASKVRILHGTGAGILRQLVRQQLEATPGIAHFEDEDVRLGGSGITVVTLK